MKQLNGYLLTEKIKHKGVLEVRPFPLQKYSIVLV